MQCVAHYSNPNRTYSKLKTLSENQLNRLLEANSVRQKETLEANRHSTQCTKIPTKYNFDCFVHGIHLDPCYKLFTKILCPSKKRKLQDTLHKVYKEQNNKSILRQQLTSFQQHASNVMLVEEREKVKLKFPIKLHYKVQL